MKNFVPRVSLITSVFKGEQFIKEFFVDITRQTIFSDCQLVLVAPELADDAPERAAIDIYTSKYKNIKFIELESDPGIYECWNIGIRASSSRYITNANLDDRKHPCFLERLWLELETHQDVDLVYAPCLMTTTPNESFEFNSSRNIYPCYEFDGVRGLLKHNSPHCNPMWRRGLHEEYGFFDKEFRSAGDHEMWLRAVSQGSIFKQVKQPLSLYYFNPKGISTNPEHNVWKAEEERLVREKYIQ